MHRHEYHIAVLIGNLHHFTGLSVGVVQFHQSPEHAYSVVDMHYVIAYLERIQLIYRELFALFYAAADLHPVETVENLMVRIQACLGTLVDESVVDVLPFDEFRQHSRFGKHRLEPFYLCIALAEDEYLIAVFALCLDVVGEELEVLVEHRLGSNFELHRRFVPAVQRQFQVHPPEFFQLREESPVLVHIAGVQPDQGGGRKNRRQAVAVGAGVCQKVRNYLHRLGFAGRYLGIAVETVDGLYLVSPEGNPVGFVVGEGEYIDERTPHRELAGRGHEVHPLEVASAEGADYIFILYFLAFAQGEDAVLYLLSAGNSLRQGVGIAHYEGPSLSSLENAGYGRRALHAEGGLVVALFEALPGMGKEENFLRIHQIVEVRAAVFRVFLVGKNDKVEAVRGAFGEHKPPGGQIEARAENFFGRKCSAFQFAALQRGDC